METESAKEVRPSGGLTSVQVTAVALENHALQTPGHVVIDLPKLDGGIAGAGIVKTVAVCSDAAMSQPSTRPTLYKGYRFPPEIISRCVWLYYRFGVSLRDVSELMLARGIEVSHETIRLWTLRFGTEYA